MATTKQLSPQQKKALKDMSNEMPDFSTQNMLGDFLSMYFTSHIIAEKLVEYKRNGKKVKQLHVKSIKSAVQDFNLQINNSIIEEIFGTTNRSKGNYSCRTLRNNYVHRLSISDKNEIETRFSQLKGYMDTWLTLFA
jgi:hypothetical protein